MHCIPNDRKLLPAEKIFRASPNTDPGEPAKLERESEGKSENCKGKTTALRNEQIKGISLEFGLTHPLAPSPPRLPHHSPSELLNLEDDYRTVHPSENVALSNRACLLSVSEMANTLTTIR